MNDKKAAGICCVPGCTNPSTRYRCAPCRRRKNELTHQRRREELPTMTKPASADKSLDDLTPWEREEVQLWLLHQWCIKRGYNPKEFGL